MRVAFYAPRTNWLVSGLGPVMRLVRFTIALAEHDRLVRAVVEKPGAHDVPVA